MSSVLALRNLKADLHLYRVEQPQASYSSFVASSLQLHPNLAWPFFLFAIVRVFLYQVGVQATATTFEDTWPDGVIPYLLGTTGTAALGDHQIIFENCAIKKFGFLLGPFLMERVPEMMSHISQVSCVRFRKWKGEVNYVHIVSGGLRWVFRSLRFTGAQFLVIHHKLRYMWDCFSCSSYVGMQQKKNIVQYGRGRCKSDRKILHELLHTLGVYHEMARNDRDKYIKIIPENIKLPNGLRKYHYLLTQVGLSKNVYGNETVSPRKQDVPGKRRLDEFHRKGTEDFLRPRSTGSGKRCDHLNPVF